MPSIQPKTAVLGYNNAYHLLRRSTYNITKPLIEANATKTPQQALSSLFQFLTPEASVPLNNIGETIVPTITNPTITDTVNNNNFEQRYWYANLMVTNNTIQYKMINLLHLFFILHDNVSYYWSNFDYLQLLRYHTNGNLKHLAIRMTKNIRMLYYLDNRLNNKNAPNENYAREFLELFTILKGEQIATGNYTTYTELDVQQAARVFTGFTGNDGDKYIRLNNYDPVTLIPEGYINVSAHDTGNKTFSAAFGNQTISGGTDEASIQQELEDFVDMVFNQMATAKSYARRMYRFFVGRDITNAIEQDIITPLAQTLYNNNYEIQPAVTQLLCSQHFYDEDDSTVGDNVIGNLVKSPLDLILQLYTIFEVNLPDYETQTAAANTFLRDSIYNDATTCGFQHLRPIDVNGYPPYSEAPLFDKLWVTANNLKPRYDTIIDKLLAGYTVNGFLIKLDSTDFVHNSGHFTDPANAATLLQEFFALLFVSTPTGDRYTHFEQALLGGLSAINWQFEWQNYISSGDTSAVTIALDNLIKAMVKSPEFQVM